MVGGTTNQPQQPPQLPPPSSSAVPATTPEEDELLKRSTDCVYFLASPLTCKKGSECEYRHSDIARVNPRDCWYWLNGNCLNPKCGFRHPPLDGLLGADVSTPMGSSVPQLQTHAPHATPYAMPKQGVACIFFQKGYCLKGHLCPFLHGPPNSVSNKMTQSGPVFDPPKKAYSGPEKPIQEQKLTTQKPVEFLPPQGKKVPRMQAPPAKNGGGSGGAVDKKVPPASIIGANEPRRHTPPTVKNEMVSNKPNRGVYQANHVSDNHRIMNGKDADEYSRELSPGFDVLVDNEVRDSEYYPNGDEFRRSRGQDYDRDMYCDYNERDGQYTWSEVELARLERKPYPRNDSPDHFDESDLRHRLAKQRRGSDNGLRSVVSRENHFSSRLRGRIKIPGRSISPIKENDPSEIDMGRKPHNQSRLRGDNDTKFTGPKRLSELKSWRSGESHDSQSLGKRRYPRAESKQSVENLSFEGPKPLSEILKRKRGAAAENNNLKERSIISVITVCTNKENLEKQTGASNTEKDKKPWVSYEEDLIDEDAMLDQELEAYDHRNGDYDYDQIDGEDYNLDEGEIPGEEYIAYS